MRFFFDNNLPLRLARAVHELSFGEDVEVIHLRDKFPANTPDLVWIDALAAEGDWVVISQDRLIKNPLEKEALRTSGLIAFILVKGWSKYKYWEKAVQMVRWWPRIIEQAGMVTGGAVFEVPWRVTGKGKFQPIKL